MSFFESSSESSVVLTDEEADKKPKSESDHELGLIDDRTRALTHAVGMPQDTVYEEAKTDLNDFVQKVGRRARRGR